jgi:hypothetical protein
VIKQSGYKSDKPYKNAFVDFIRSRQWHWFITIPIGLCGDDEEVLKRLRTIEATLCGKYLVNRYHRLPDDARFSMVVAFEGEVKCGTRHAHILAYIPSPTKKRIPQSMLFNLFPFEFRFLWHKFSFLAAAKAKEVKAVHSYEYWTNIKFGATNTARAIYTVKDVRQDRVSWSRFEFVTPPKYEKFNNENLNVIRNRHRQRKAVVDGAQA